MLIRRLSRRMPGILLLAALPALPCSCVVAVNSNARTAMNSISLVFRGTVAQRETLPRRADMKGRDRYAISFQVEEYWKGSPGRKVTLYGLDGGTDCLGDGGYEIGKSYLVYASEQAAEDVQLEGTFWYGWTDVLPPGSKMLVPQTACMPGGESSSMRNAIRQLGKGRVPGKTD
jgi:hypothetical protein